MFCSSNESTIMFILYASIYNLLINILLSYSTIYNTKIIVYISSLILVIVYIYEIINFIYIYIFKKDIIKYINDTIDMIPIQINYITLITILLIIKYVNIFYYIILIVIIYKYVPIIFILNYCIIKSINIILVKYNQECNNIINIYIRFINYFIPFIMIDINNETNLLQLKYALCSICLEPIRMNGIKTSCNHQYHKNCIKKWINLNHRSCPLCREDLFL
jgi:hypothetical protein